MMKNLLFLFFSLISISAFAQEVRKCGTIYNTETYEQVRQRAWEVSQMVHNSPNQAELRDDEITWIPVKYHLVSRVASDTYAKVRGVLDLHCRLNEEYAALNIQFYINDGFNYFQSDAAYDDPGGNGFALGFQRDITSIDIFITGTATSGNPESVGVTLGYFSPTDDWIVIKKDQVNYSSNTLIHEMGHFLSLPHTFQGWDFMTWQTWAAANPNQCAPTVGPTGGTPTEFQDGSNCDTAGDFICDTPPDYLFGLEAGSCSWGEEVCDPQGDIVDPMEENYMGYFPCTDQVFTEDQGIQMVMAMALPERNYLQFDGGPDRMDVVDEIANLNTPANGANTEFSNGVTFSWSDLPHTTTYYLQIAENSAFTLELREYLDWQPGAYISNLEAGKEYHWRVRGYNEYSTCSDWSETRTFTTGMGITGVSEISEVEIMTVSPNPVSVGANLTVNVQSSTAFDATLEVVNLNGQVLKTITNQNFRQGRNTINVAMDNLATGLYFVRIRTAAGVMNRRVIVAQ